MRRREMFRAILAGTGVFVGLRQASAAATDTTTAEPSTPKVVYHLSDLDKVGFVLGNIRNHFHRHRRACHNRARGAWSGVIRLPGRRPVIRSFQPLCRPGEGWAGILCLRQHHDEHGRFARRSSARLRQRRHRWRGQTRRTAIAGIRLSQAIGTQPANRDQPHGDVVRLSRGIA